MAVPKAAGKMPPVFNFAAEAPELNSISAFVSFGCPWLDLINGGGFPLGRVHHWVGLQGSGKTTLMLSVAQRAAQEHGVAFVLFDTEQSQVTMTLRGQPVAGRLKQFGFEHAVNMILHQDMRSIEAIGKRMHALQTTYPDTPFLFVIDSIAASLSQESLDAFEGDKGLRLSPEARAWRAALRHYLAVPAPHPLTTLILVNHAMEDFKASRGYYKAYWSPGGSAPKFFSHIDLMMKRGAQSKNEYGITAAQELKVTVNKNRYTNPFQTSISQLWLGVNGQYAGLDGRHGTLLYLKKYNLLQTSGGGHTTFTCLNDACEVTGELHWQGDSDFFERIYPHHLGEIIQTMRVVHERLVLVSTGNERPPNAKGDNEGGE